MPTWSAGISLKGLAGAAGLSVLTGSGAPASTLGVQGQAYVDIAGAVLYVKGASAWNAGVSLVGPSGGNATLPNDITGNSITLGPVSGDNTPTSITVKNSGGTTVYKVDVSGNETVGGSASVGGTLTVTSQAVAQSYAASSVGSTSTPAFGVSGSFRGTNNASLATGVYFGATFGQLYEMVAGYTSRSQTFQTGNPSDTGVGFITHSFATKVGGGNTAYSFAAGDATPLILYGSGAAQVGATLGVTGLTTSAGIKLSSGALTFADGTSISTAPAASAPGSANTFNAQTLGTAAAPAFAYKATGSGTYFDANGNVLCAVNGFKSLYSDAASGAAAGANGWAIASTRANGAMLLSLYGNGGTSPSTTIDGAGVLTTAQATLNKLTFADGTSMATATTSNPYLTGFGAGIGPIALSPVSTAFSATPYVLPYPGSSIASTFTPIAPSALLGLYAYSSVAITLTLYNVTTSTSVYSVNLTAYQSLGGNYFSTTQYPMAANNTYQWQVTGSSSGNVQVQGFFMQPSNTPALAVQTAFGAGFATNTTFSSTAQSVPNLGTTTTAGIWAYAPPRTGGIYSAQATYTPASGTASSATVTPTLYYGSLSSGSGAAVAVTFSAVSATGLPQTLLTPRLTDLTSLTTGNYYYWKVVGSGTGTLSLTLLTLT